MRFIEYSQTQYPQTKFLDSFSGYDWYFIDSPKTDIIE